MLEALTILLSIVSIILAIVAVTITLKIERKTSDYLKEIQINSRNMTNKAMNWIEHLIFTDMTPARKDKIGGIQTSKKGKDTITSQDVLNCLYELKGATLAELQEKSSIDYGNLKLILNRLLIGSYVKRYSGKNSKYIYTLPETIDEAYKKYPEKEFEEEGIPF